MFLTIPVIFMILYPMLFSGRAHLLSNETHKMSAVEF